MSRQDDSQIVELITRHQGELRAYILSLLYRWPDAQDVLQETNMILWQKRAIAPPAGEFLPWACKVAYYQVLTFRKRHQRSRLFFSEHLIGELAASDSTLSTSEVARTEALQKCMTNLPPRSKELLKQRYYTQRSVEEIAAGLGRTAQAVSQSLYRVRKRLLECLQTRLRAADGGD